MKYEGRGPSTSGITEIGNYGHTEKPPRAELWSHGGTESSCRAAEIRKYGSMQHSCG